MPNELSGQSVNVGASKIVELFTPKAENTGSADDRDLDALAVEDISVHGNPLFPLCLRLIGLQGNAQAFSRSSNGLRLPPQMLRDGFQRL